jgi:hypothetical protein
MTKVLLVTYNLTQQGRDYTSLYEALKTARDWWHYLDSTWLIAVEDSPVDWYCRLAPHMTQADGLLIIEVTQRYYGALPPDAWSWIANKVGPRQP